MVAFTAGAVLTAANLNTAFNALTFRAVTGTSDTFLLADNGGAVSYSNASAITATVPPFSSVAYANGTKIELLNLGAGVVTVTAGVGVTLNGSSVTLAQNAGGTLIKTATNTWYFLPSSTGSGMDLITPTSVAGSGVTLSGGQVSFTTATDVSVNGCFTAAYSNYQLVYELSAATVTGYVSMRLRLSGSDAATNYASSFTYAGFSNDTAAGFGVGNGTTALVMGFNDGGGGSNITWIMAPALARRTATHFLANNPNVSTGSSFAGGGIHSTATAYDGMTLRVPSGNMTGTLRIYGLRNS